MKDTRICPICRAEKPLDNFYVNRTKALGHDYLCKSCRRKKNRERDKQPHRILKSKKWLQSERGKELARKRFQEDYTNNKQKYSAQRAIRRLIKLGMITRQPCERCGNGNGCAHHPDYSKPFDVVWLCQSHHAEEHRKL